MKTGGLHSFFLSMFEWVIAFFLTSIIIAAGIYSVDYLLNLTCGGLY